MTTINNKPLGRKAYGSIGHLPNSRLGPSDSCVSSGQAKICTERSRDARDVIIVQEKLDGSCVAVAKKNSTIIPLTRAGYRAESSPYEQHHIFARWAIDNQQRFHEVLAEGERIVGEWLAQAHGTLYDLEGVEPFVAFDIMVADKRMPYEQFADRTAVYFLSPHVLHYGTPLPVDAAMEIHKTTGFRCDEPEGLVYRVERDGRVDFLAKYVRPDKIDGKYLPEITGNPEVWNWRP